MAYTNKTSVEDVKLDKHLRPLAKEFNMKHLRNMDKSTHIKTISLYLVQNGMVETKSLTNLSRDDIKICKQ